MAGTAVAQKLEPYTALVEPIVGFAKRLCRAIRRLALAQLHELDLAQVNASNVWDGRGQ